MRTAWSLIVLAGCAAEPELATRAAAVEVTLVCDEAPAPADHADAIPDCDAVVGGRALDRGNLLAAAPLDRGRLILLTRERELVVRRPDGAERVIARDAADPRVEGARVVYTQLPAGGAIAPDTVGTLVVLDLERGTRRVAVEDPHASAPFLVPGTDEVLYVSSRTGVASLWLASPGAAPRQLTNVGMRRLDPARFVPVPGRELTWIDGTRTAIFVARYDGVATRWSIDVDTGVAAPVAGPGGAP